MNEFFVIQNELTKQYLVDGRSRLYFSSNLSDADQYSSPKEALDTLTHIREDVPWDYGEHIAGNTFEIKQFINFQN